ncbi:MAG: recombinase family protein [Clostridia bacterium]|nr:recombinase family protein [Clostridia bacterium]
MDIYEMRKALKTQTIYDLPLRVTYYARVSTEKIEQLNSLENQVSYYEDKIKSNSFWTFVDGYVDEGITGITTKKRENFNRMIDDAKDGKFDLILTKEISRFARNTVDSIEYTRALLSYGVPVYFESDNIKTYDEDSEFRLTLMASMAQDELRRLSSRVRFGHEQAIKNNVVLGNSNIFGYKKENKRLVIDEEQAVFVRKLFEMYATDKYSMKELENHFWDNGYRNTRGNKIAHSTMAGIISNPKYKGYYVGNKVKVIDMFTKKQKFLPPEEWVMFKDETGEIVPAIVDEELWEKANQILQRRSDDVKKRKGVSNHANLLTGKLFCSDCGVPYYRRESKSKDGTVNSKWVCSGKINNGRESCDSLPIYESEIIPVIFEVFKDTSETAKSMIDEYEKMYASLSSDKNTAKQIKRLESQVKDMEERKFALLGQFAKGNITEMNYKTLTEKCDEEIANANELLTELKQEQQSNEAFRKTISTIRATLKKAEKEVASGTITKEFVDSFIDKIIVTPEKNNTIKLDIRIFTGKTTTAYIEKLKSRMGQTSKKMIESYENSMK